jgi:hypothetical protein
MITSRHIVSAIMSSLSLFIGTFVQAAVWETSQSWDAAWEGKYQSWVSREWDKNFFLRSGGLMQNAEVDCADAVYTMRAYFSARNGLPFAIKDPTTRREDAVISNNMTKWDSLPSEERIRRFIRYLYSVGSTATLPNDSYPTAIDPVSLNSGSFILTDRANHHSWTIRSFSQTGVPHLIFASRPAKPVLFERKDFPSTSFVFPNGIRPETHAGFRNFRHPHEIGRPVHEVVGFSLEQYDFPARNYMRNIQKRMQRVEETHEARVNRLLAEVCTGSQERVDAVRSAARRNEELGSVCMSSTEFDDHSTPSRDARLKSAFEDLVAAFQDGLSAKSLTSETQGKLQDIVSGNDTPIVTRLCPIEISSGRLISLGHVFKAVTNGLLSTNPHDTIFMRWGLAKFPSSKARSCPVY